MLRTRAGDTVGSGTAGVTRPEEKFVRLGTVRELTGMKTSTIYQAMQQGSFPRPVALGKRARAWALSEVQGWMAQRLAERNQAQSKKHKST